MRLLRFLAAILLISCTPSLIAKDQSPCTQPLVIPISGGGQSTTTKLGSGYTTRTTGGQSFSTTQLGSTTITRDSSGHTWRTKGVRSRLISLRFTLRAAIMQPTAQMPKLLGSQPAPAGMCSCMPDSSASLPIRIPAWI